jgi:hypothetical protein
MKVIVIRQPWAWLIVNGYKDIENRSWATRYRGALLIQASARVPPAWEMEEHRAWCRKHRIPLPEEFETGGIVGMVELKDCVTESSSEWFHGPVGWKLRNARQLKFIPCKGQLGLFDPPAGVGRRVKAQLGIGRPGRPPACPRMRHAASKRLRG